MIGMVRRVSARMARRGALTLAAAGMALSPLAAAAQVRTVDPNTAIDADLAPVPPSNSTPTEPGVDSSVPPANNPAPDSSAATANSTATGAPVTAG